MEQNLEKFLITYVETEDFNKMIEEEQPISPESLIYAKILAPSMNEVSDVLGRRFSDVQVIGIAAETDFILSLKKLENVPQTADVYVVAKQDMNGNAITDVVIDKEQLEGEEVVAQLKASEFLDALNVPLSFLKDPATPTIRFDE